MHHQLAIHLLRWSWLVPCLLLSACQGLRSAAADKPGGEEETTKKAGEMREVEMANAGQQPDVGLAFLLSMSFEEAKTLSAQNLVLSPNVRVAADSIEVVKTTRDGKPKRVRAKGKVFLEMGNGDAVKVLCHEAYFGTDEAVLRGKPILQRGGSIIEGLDHSTVFYTLGSRLRVIGTHRVTNQNEMIASLPDLGPWTGGPNPLLPPLTENAVPRNIRAELEQAAEAEAVLQRNRAEAQEEGPPAPWIKEKPQKSPNGTSA